MIKSILQKIGYYDTLRQEKIFKSIRDKKQDINFKLLLGGLQFIFLLSITGGFLVHNMLFFVFLSCFPLFIYAVERESYLAEKCKKEINQLHLNFFDNIDNNQNYLKEIANLSIDETSQNMFLIVVDNYLRKDKKECLFEVLQHLANYRENLGEQQSYLSQRDSFLSSLDLPITYREVVDEKSYQNKARERFLEML